MAARRPRTPKPDPVAEDTTKTSPPPPAEETRGAKPSPGIAYASLRITGNVHKLRHSTNPKLIEASNGQSITLLAGKTAPDGTFIAFPHYLIEPSGVEIHVSTVTSAIPSASQAARRASRAERLAEREANLKRVMGERAAEQTETKKKVVQVVDDDDEPDESISEDDEDTRLEESEGDDGIDI